MQKTTRRAMMMARTTTTTPTAIPMMAPVDRPPCVACFGAPLGSGEAIVPDAATAVPVRVPVRAPRELGPKA